MEKQKFTTQEKKTTYGYFAGVRLFGVYSPEDDLLCVHATEYGADANKKNYERDHGDGFYVDYVMVNE